MIEAKGRAPDRYSMSRCVRISVVLLLALLAFSPATASAATPASGLGVNGWYLFWELPASQWDGPLGTMAANGVQVVRADALWESVEPSPPDAAGHHYQWSAMDAIAAALARHGLRWLPIIDYSTTWAASVSLNGRPDLESAPSDVASYAAYAGAFVGRYGPGGAFWAAHPGLTPQPVTAIEIWNEPNAAWTWGGSPNAAQYAALYEAARRAAHAANPGVEVVIGGLSNPADAFLDGIYAAVGGGPGQIDGVAEHPYGSNASAVIANVYRLRIALDSHGDANVPIDVTEFGWPTRGYASWIPTLSDSQRAGQLTQVVNTLAGSDCGVERILPYSWVTAEANSQNIEDWFGLFNPNGTATTSGSAFTSALAALEGAPAVGHATVPVCGRPLTLTLSQVSSVAGSLCMQATALTWSLTGWASVGVSGTSVRMTVPGAAAVNLTTGSSGQAVGCFTLPAGSQAQVSATAQQPFFYQIPSATLSASVPTAPGSTTPAAASSSSTARATKTSSRLAHAASRPHRHKRSRSSRSAHRRRRAAARA